MGKIFCLVIIACVAVRETPASTTEEPQRTVPCGESVAVTQFPYPGYRLVLGAASVPRAYGRAYPSAAWPYFAKGGVVVKSGRSVTLRVPRAWRKRVAISWGNNVHRVFHTIRIAACSRTPTRGYAYAGGFYLRGPSACAPLVVAAGGRRQTIWFGIGRRCR